MIHSIRPLVEKRRGAESPVVAAEFTWRRPDLPSRSLFPARVEETDDLVELPY